MPIRRLRTATTRRALISAIAALSTTLTPLPVAAQPGDRGVGCGFRHVNPDHHNGAVSLYTHCADSFILIRVDGTGGSHHRCVGPRGSVPFYSNEGVRNAYYVSIRPRLILAADGRQLCSLTQPSV